MLKIADLTGKFHTGEECALLLGGFDGMHIGHRMLLEKAKTLNLPVGVMCISGGKGGADLFTFSEREAIFASLGADFAFELDFEEIRDLSPAQFADLLLKEFSPAAFFCGSDFRFGKGAAGTPDFLGTYTGIRTDVSGLLELDGEKVSSGTVKKLLERGDVLGAARLLGGSFFVGGEVLEDRHVGRTIGFPTANILYPGNKFPLKRAVYETRVQVDGREYRCITNFGSRPTFHNDRVLTETYLDGFSGNLYGRTLNVGFVRFLRDIRAFSGAEELEAQLTEDIGRVRRG